MFNNLLNFRTPLYTILFFALFLMTACQKENIQPTLSSESLNSHTLNSTTETHEIDLSNLANQMKSNARNNAWTIGNRLVDTDLEGPYNILLDMGLLRDPNAFRIEVTVIPFDKPTNLKVLGVNENQPGVYTDIKESSNPGMQVDFVKFRPADLLADETHAMVRIEWEGAGNKFEYKINAIPVDCQEDRPRNQGDVGIAFQPVCGCDGRTYFDATAAYNAGITSYERGQCAPNLNIPEGIWEAIDVDFPYRHLEIVKEIADKCELIIIRVVDECGKTHIFKYIFCPEDEDEIFIYVVDVLDCKESQLFWPVEKWDVNINKQGELEIYRTNGADKDQDEKKDHTTILSRFKRKK